MSIVAIKRIKTVLLFISLAFLLIAFIALLLIALSLFFTIKSLKECSEVLYWISICSSTICLCILPIMSYFNSRQGKEDGRIRDELCNTTKFLDDFAELVHSKEFSFSRNVVISFYINLDVRKLTQRFHDYSSNDIYFDFLDYAIKESITSKKQNSNSTLDDWGDYLISSINSCWHLFSLDKELEIIEDYKKVDKFCSSLLYVCNKLEIIAYNIMEARINKKTYMEELFRPIDSIYSDFYYFLVKIGSDSSFPKLDVSCRILSKENEIN